MPRNSQTNSELEKANAQVDAGKIFKNISFRLIRPQTPFRAPYSLKDSSVSVFTQILMNLETLTEFFNTRVQGADAQHLKKIKELCYIPKMSTFAIGVIIDSLVFELRNNACFVNVGVWNGFTFLAGLVNNPRKKCIGIDNFSEFGGPREEFLERFNRYKSDAHHFYEMDYERYFHEIHRDRIGFYIYDGEHSYRNQLKGLQVAEPFFADDCTVLIDDTNIPDVHRATVDFMAQSKHKYRVIVDQKTFHNTHPTYWNGLIVFQKIPGHK